MKRSSYKLLGEKYEQTVLNEIMEPSRQEHGHSTTLADMFSDELAAHNYPKSNYEAAEVMNIISNFLEEIPSSEKSSPAELNRIYDQMFRALEWNDIDPGLLKDYLDMMQGSEDNFHDEAVMPVKEPITHPRPTIPGTPAKPSRPHPLTPTRPGIEPRPKALQKAVGTQEAAHAQNDVQRFLAKRTQYKQ